MDSMEALEPGGWGTDPTVRYAPVRMDKFLALSLLTFGLYEIVWFYRNWRYTRDIEDADVWPWARALFGPLWYFSLARRLDLGLAPLLGLSYLVVTATWRLPDPWWLISMLSVVFLLPAVSAINRRNGAGAAQAPYYGWRKRSAAVATLGLVMLPLAALGTFGPSTAVVTGAEMTSTDLTYLKASGIVGDDEEVLFFYSAGLTSIQGQGVVATDRGVASYWTDAVSEELMVAFLAYEEIASVEVNQSATWLEDTMVRLSNAQGDWFAFPVSPEGGGDARFLEEIERRRNAPPDGVITA